MSASEFFKKMQDYGKNPDNGYMDDVYLKLIKEKQLVGETLSQEEQDFVEYSTNKQKRG